MIRLLRNIIVLGGMCWCGYTAYTWYINRQPAAEADEQTAPQASPVARHREQPTNHAPTPIQAPASGTAGIMEVFRGVADKIPGIGARAQSPALAAPTQPSGGSLAVYYSPWQNLEAIDYNSIEHSRCNHLDVAMYSLTNFQLARAIVDFAATGRQVRIYRDRAQYEQEQSRGSYVANLFYGKPHIAIRVKGSRTLMHIKAWSDGCILREGSANWSPSGEKQQDNTLTLLTDRTSIDNFEADFQVIWNRPDNVSVQ